MIAASGPIWQLVLVPAVCVALTVVAAIGILKLIDKFFGRGPTKQHNDLATGRFEARLMQPDFDAVEKHFGVSLPGALKAIYSDRDQVLRSDFEVVTNDSGKTTGRWFLAFFEPADAESLRESWPGCESCFAFANDGCGNEYVIKPGSPDPEVLFHDHETGEFTNVAPTLSSFLAAPRVNPPE